MVGGLISLVFCIIFTLLTVLTCAAIDSFTSVFMITALLTGVLFAAARAAIISIADPESGVAGFIISIIQQLMLSTFVHDFLSFLDDNVAFFNLIEFLDNVVGMIFDLTADQVKAMKLADLVKMMIEEEADEIQLAEEMKIEAELEIFSKRVDGDAEAYFASAPDVNVPWF